MKRIALLILGATFAGPASAYDLGKATNGKPEAVVQGPADLFVAERCIMMIDGISSPSVYRTPDRPNESLIYYLGGGGHPIAYKLEKDGAGVVITIYNGSKWRDKVEACTKGGE